MKVNRVKNVETKWNRRTFEINFHVNDQHHAQKRRSERQMMNRVNQNNQLSSKSFFDDKQINHFFRNRHETKILFRSSSSNWDNELCHETQINHEMKKTRSQIVLCRTCKLREKSHLSNVTSQWDHLSCFVCYVNQEKAKRIISFHFWNIDKTIDHEINHTFDEKTCFEIEFDNHSHAFVSTRSINWCRLILFNTLNNERKHIKHRVNFVNFDSQRHKTSFRITLSFRFFWSSKSFDHEMQKNVIDSQQVLKSRSYKKTMNDSNREEWIKIMKNENIFFLINEIWTLINSFKDRRVLRDKWIYKIKREEHDEILRYKTRWMIREFEQIERLNYTKTFVSMIKSMSYKTMYVIIVVNDWKNRTDKRQDNFFVWQNSRERLRRTIHEIWTRNQQDLQVKQNSVRFQAIFESVIRNVDQIFFLFRLRFVKRRIQCLHEKRHYDCYLCEWFNFYKIRSRDYLLIEKRFKRTIRNERFRFLHLLFRHDDFQKSKSQTINSESKCLRWTDATKSWNVRLQIINHFHKRLVSSDKNFWRVYCWQKFQNQLSINREIIDVYHVKNSIEHNLFYLDDQSLCLQSHLNSLISSQTHLSLFTRNTSDEIDVSRSIKISKELHELELNRKSRYQTINFWIRVQRWQWRHQLILEKTIHRDIIYLWDRIYETNLNDKRSNLITKSDDSVDMRRRIFSNDNDIREQSKRYCSDQKFSISRTNQAHRYSNSFHQRKSDWRIHRLNLRVYRSNDNWWSDKIINQRQICSVSRCFRNRVIIFSSLNKTFSWQQFVRIYQMFRDNNLWKSINALRDSNRQSSVKSNNESAFLMKVKSSSHLITSFLLI